MWLLLVCAGLAWLLRYENAPGAAAAPPTEWPRASHLLPSAEHATLVMSVHPKCPCTRASLGELAAIMAHSQGHVTTFVLFVKPAGFADDWEKTDLWKSATEIPGVTAVVDNLGREATLFQSQTSGQTMLYNARGHLMFRGGITASRGHSGDNAGRSSIISIVNAEGSYQSSTPVFGCPLFDPESTCKISGNEKNAR